MAEVVLIDFQADYSTIDNAIEALEKSGAVDAKLANSFKQTNAEINKQAELIEKDAKAAKTLDNTLSGVNKTTKTLTETFSEGFQEGVTDALKEAGLSVIQLKQKLGLIDKSSPFKKLSDQLAESQKRILETSARLQQLSATGGKGTEVFNKLEKQLKADQSEFKRLTDQMNATRAALDTTVKPIKDTGEAATSAKMRLRLMREELLNLADQGLENTEQFRKLQKEAGKLADDIGDVQARIRSTGSDTRVFDGLLNAAQGVAAGFSIAQGAAALLDKENENLNETLVKVTSTTAILQGLQQIQQVLQKESAASLLFLNNQQKVSAITTQLMTGVESKNVIVKYASIAATKALSLAQSLANPVTLAVVAAITLVTAAYKFFTAEAKKAAEEQTLLNQQLEAATEIAKELDAGTKRANSKRLAELKANGASEAAIRKVTLKQIEEQLIEARSREEAFQQQADAASARRRASTNEKEIGRLAEIEKKFADFQQNRIDLETELFIAQQENTAALKKEQEEALKTRSENLKKQQAESLKLRREELEQTIAGLKEEQIRLDENSYRWKNLQKAINDTTAELDNLEQAGKKASLVLALAAEENRKLFTPPLQEIEQSQRELDLFLGIGLRKRINAAKAINAAEKTFIVDSRQAEEAQLNIRRQNYESFLEDVKALAQTIQNIYQQLSSSLKAVSDEQNLAIDITLGNQRKQVEEQLKLGQITEKEAERRNARIDAQERVLKTKQAQRDKQIALFNAFIGVAQAIVQALTAGPIIGPILAAVVGALGAAQIAAISARPIPKFSKGKKNKYEGPALIGESGSELVTRSDGSMEVTKKPTYTWIGKDDKVFTHFETMNILKPTEKTIKERVEKTHDTFDYDKLSKIMAKNMPKSAVVNINKDFISESVAEGLSKMNYFDKYYTLRKR